MTPKPAIATLFMAGNHSKTDENCAWCGEKACFLSVVSFCVVCCAQAQAYPSTKIPCGRCFFLHWLCLDKGGRGTLGPGHLTPSRRVMAVAMKLHQHDKPFSAASCKMASLNSDTFGMILDPFRFQETFLANFLRSQGLLLGPCITDHRSKSPTQYHGLRSRIWTQHNTPDTDCLPDLPSSSSSEDLTSSSPTIPQHILDDVLDNLQTLWTSTSNFGDSVAAYITTRAECVRREEMNMDHGFGVAKFFGNQQQLRGPLHVSDMLKLFIYTTFGDRRY